ncbi:MAG: mevalonate kinase [halophilic archaeon J07HX64]|jgi:mevalonate kinase (EC 2.7.1.36)|nr:MAG: mevalonate kinase [halophilic archaeon J07HX64]
MVTSSAPGKVYLFGEHAVVYGEPAVPCAIGLRAQAAVERRTGGLRVRAGDLSLDGFAVEYNGGTSTPEVDVPENLLDAAMGYVNGAIDQAREAARTRGVAAEERSFEVTVDSNIPLGAGLGSSAAVVVATIDAAARELGVQLPREELADRAYRVEHTVQDGGASRADTFCATMGGAVRIEGDDCETLATPDLPLVVGYDGGAGDTGELVAQVRGLRETHPFVADTVSAVGDLVRRGERALAADDRETLGELMDINHGLLSSLGVSARSLDAMVWAARDGGAHGAKLTGAGGGGCIVALGDPAELERALSYAPACDDAFHAQLDTDGLRREDE